MKISNWAFQWKMRFNPDPNKQAREVIFSRETKNAYLYIQIRGKMVNTPKRIVCVLNECLQPRIDKKQQLQ